MFRSMLMLICLNITALSAVEIELNNGRKLTGEIVAQDSEFLTIKVFMGAYVNRNIAVKNIAAVIIKGQRHDLKGSNIASIMKATPASSGKKTKSKNQAGLVMHGGMAWRGNYNGDFGATSGPTQWDAKSGKNIIWKALLKGKTLSSPVLAGDKIFALAEEALLYCIDKKTGEILWEKDNAWSTFGTKYAHRDMKKKRFENECFGFTSASPVTDGKHVWASLGHGLIVCYDFEGKRIWDGEFKQRTHWRRGHASAPLLINGVIVTSYSGVYGWDARTGKNLWVSKVNGGTYGGKIPLRIQGKDYCLTSAGALHDARTGEVVLKGMMGTKGTPYNYGPSVIYADGLAVFHCLTKENIGFFMRAARIEPGKPAEVVWEYDMGKGKGGSMARSALYHDGLIYVAAGDLHVLDAETGGLVYKQDVDSSGWCSLARTGQLIYLISKKRATIFRTGKSYQEVASFNHGFKNTAPSPIFAGKFMYFRDGQTLYCIGQ